MTSSSGRRTKRAAHHGKQCRGQHAIERNAEGVGEIEVGIIFIGIVVGVHSAVHTDVDRTAIEQEYTEILLEFTHAFHVFTEILILKVREEGMGYICINEMEGVGKDQ